MDEFQAVAQALAERVDILWLSDELEAMFFMVVIVVSYFLILALL